MSLQLLREAIAADITFTTALQGHPYLESSVQSGHAYVSLAGPDEYTFGEVHGTYLYTATVRAYRQTTEPVEAQRYFDLLRDPQNSESVKAALEQDPVAVAALGTVKYLRVGRATEPAEYVPAGVEGITFLFVDWPVEVVI